LGFVLDGLESESYDRQYSDLALVRRIWAYFRPQGRPMLIATAALVLSAFVNAAIPLIVARSIDLLTGNPATGRIAALVVGVLILRSSSWALNYLRQTYSVRAMSDVVLSLARDVFRAVTQQDLSFFDEQPSGKIVSRVSSDTQDFANTVDLTLNLLSETLSVLVITIIAFTISVRLTLIMLVMTPVVALISLSFRKIARQVTLNARRILAKVNDNIQESVSGIAIAKGFRQEQRMYLEFSTLNRQTFRVNLLRGLTLQTIFPILDATYGVALAVVLYLGGRGMLQGTAAPGTAAPSGALMVGALTVGQWYLFVQAMGYYWFPMMAIASFWSQFQDGLSAAERVFALIDAEPRVIQTLADERLDRLPVPRLRGQVQYRHVRLIYTGEEVVLPNFSLEIAAGETVALVGHTGSGKTSVARLLARFYEFQGGEILVDGQDIRTFDLAQYRRQLGIVPQAPFLFSGTVLENIRYGEPEATDAQVEEVARQVGGGDWLQDLPQGLHTDVGERGARLSMGQRQLVALARVLLHNPAIFILDEATASVDPFTEAQIQEGLDLVMRERTSIVIAHRLSTVRNVDRILVMRKGEIIEEGNHAALMAAGGHYAELYNTYFRHQSLEYIETARRLAGL
jgi:ATP-binding cassette subfamily B protein